jgi:hypothetical protein
MAALAMLAAGSAEAGGFGRVAEGSGTILVPAAGAEATQLEWLRYARQREGRRVVVPLGAGQVATIEWWQPVEVRVRTESGRGLTGPEQAAVSAEAMTCRRGEPRDASARTERNGTFVVEFRCAWLQGLEGQ